ncbi:CGNR zinc finger domain-containing protein [Kitasatospora kifunensis]|uniref:Putative RNA-binding Zn ribbon-like protein n=1 Tax=Kitasatospora kifunensis TaxID=58351 RepID=A0A7W7R287_KITKI|nr:ABATE domain-containing protein [Kitasatospora kifunensis]MBB4924097.1 putative RNA-binding Zn ribbon-like protein [Kitasatospora kifunensis]
MTETAALSALAPLPPAPGADQHVALDFANSDLALPAGRLDLLDTPAAATRWLVERGLAPADAELFEICAGRLRELRVHLRALLASRTTGTPAPPEALSAVNTALTTAPSADLLGWDAAHGLHRLPAHPADRVAEHAMAVIAADAAELLTGPDAERLAACAGTPCNRYLIRTHAARHWCSTRCGDRVRAARAYARRQQAKAG